MRISRITLLSLVLSTVFLVVGCSEDLSEEKTYEYDINWKDINTKAEVRTKYFNEKLNYIVVFQNENEPCIFDPNTSYLLNFRDSDGFNLAERRLYISEFTANAENTCNRFIQGSITIDKNAYKEISKISIGTRTSK